MSPLLMHAMRGALEYAGQQRQQREAALPLVVWLSPTWCAHAQLGSKPPASLASRERRSAGEIDAVH